MDALQRAISSAIAEASAGRPVTVLDLAAAGSTAFQVMFDEIGVPRIRRSDPVTWDSVDSGAVHVPSGALIIVSSAPDLPPVSAALAGLRAARPDAPAWEIPGASVSDLLAEAVGDAPIRQAHELLVARADVGTSRIRLTSELLFAAGSRRGDVATLDVRCEQDDGSPTVLAVVGRDSLGPYLLSAGQVPLQPGRHRIRAELAGGGVVRFIEPAGVDAYPGGLSDLIAGIPTSMNSVRQACLICAIEISGQASLVAARLYCAERLIRSLHQHLPGLSQLQVSIVGYGAHRFKRDRPDERVIVTDWMSPPDRALASLGWIGAADLGYPEAAQIEDMLAEVTHRLSPKGDLPPTALLVFGDRPPHPARVEATDKLLPCPFRHDWRQSLDTLNRRQNVVVVAIRDDLSAQGTAAWARIGETLLLPRDSVDTDTLWHRIGFVVPSLQDVPVPVID